MWHDLIQKAKVTYTIHAEPLTIHRAVKQTLSIQWATRISFKKKMNWRLIGLSTLRSNVSQFTVCCGYPVVIRLIIGWSGIIKSHIDYRINEHINTCYRNTTVDDKREIHADSMVKWLKIWMNGRGILTKLIASVQKRYSMYRFGEYMLGHRAKKYRNTPMFSMRNKHW